MVDLTYRKMRESDYDALFSMMSDWPVVRQLGGWPWPADPEFTRSRCKPFEGNGFVWAICMKDRLIGNVGVIDGDLGYVLDAEHHGKGIMSLAACRAIDEAFDTTDRDHLTGSVWHDNRASSRVLQKLGFTHWQTRYTHAKARKLPTLVHHLRLTRADWDRLRSAAQ